MTPVRATLASLGVLAVTTAGLLAPALFADETLLLDDFARYELPQHLVTARALAEGRLPAWNPHLYLGVPHLANPTTAVFYPPTWLDATLPVLAALNLRVFLHLVLAAMGAWFAAKRLGVTLAGATLAGAVFAFGGPLLGYAGNPFYLHAAAWTPWAIAAWLGVLRGDGPRAAIATGIALALSLLAGDPQAALCGGLWLVALTLGRAQEVLRRLATWIGAAIAAVTALGLASVQLLPSGFFLSESVRAAGTAGPDVLHTWSLAPLRLINLLVPGAFGSPAPVYTVWAHPLADEGRHWFGSLYLGALTPALAALALGRREGRMLAVGAAAFVLLALGDRTPVLPWLVAHVPGFGLFRFPEKYALHAALALALGAGLGLDRALAGGRAAIVALLAPALCGAAAWGLSTWVYEAMKAWSRVPNADAALSVWRSGALVALGAGLAGGIVAASGDRLAGWKGPVLVAVTLIDLVFANTAPLETAPRALLDEPPPLAARLSERAAGVPVRLFRDASVERERLARDLDALLANALRRRAALDTAAQVQAGFEDIAGYTAALPADRDGFAERLWPDLALWAPRLGLRFILIPRGPLPPIVAQHVTSGLLTPWLDDPVANVRVLEVTLPTDPVHCEDALGVALPPAACHVVSRGRPDRPAPPDRIDAMTDLAEPARLVHAASFGAGWSALLDDEPTPIERTHGFLQAVRVPPGVHTVALRYDPPGLAPGAALSALTLAVVVGALWALGFGRTGGLPTPRPRPARGVDVRSTGHPHNQSE